MTNHTMASMTGAMERNALLMFYATSTPGDHATMFFGAPGGGKTTAAAAVARALGCDDEHIERWSVGQMDVPDFNGYATPRADGLHFECQARIKTLCDGRPAMFILDELGNADRPIQAAALKPLDSRTIGEQRIPNSCRIVGFLNPPESTTDMQDLAFALMNRAAWLPWEPIEDHEHVAFILSGQDASANINLPSWKGDDQYRLAYNEMAALYSTYKLNLRQGTLWEECTSDEVKSRWPMVACSPRSWALFIRLAATARLYGDTLAMRAFALGTLGEPQANLWMNFYETADLIPALDLIKNPLLWTPDPMRTDQTFAQLMSVAVVGCDGRDIAPKELVARWNGAWGVVQHALDSGEGEDVALIAAQHLGSNKPKGQLLASIIPTIQRLQPMVAASLMDDSEVA